MIRVHIVVEGQTEEAFVSEVLGPALYPIGVYPTARLIGKPGHKGGGVTYQRARQDIVLLLKQDPGAFCTTLFDFYGLGAGFPGTPLPRSHDNIRKVFRQIREQFATPEDINEGPDTAPSKRVIAAHPQYRKPLYGALAAMSVGIAAMRRECPHFNQWVTRLEALAVVRP